MEWVTWVVIVTVIILILIVIVTLPPLLHLIDEGVNNPRLFIVEYKVKNDELLVTLTYNGNVTLSDVTVYINGHNINFGPMSKGETKTKSIPLREVGDISTVSISFKVGWSR